MLNTEIVSFVLLVVILFLVILYLVKQCVKEKFNNSNNIVSNFSESPIMYR